MEVAERYWSTAREAEGLAMQVADLHSRALYLRWAARTRLGDETA